MALCVALVSLVRLASPLPRSRPGSLSEFLSSILRPQTQQIQQPRPVLARQAGCQGRCQNVLLCNLSGKLLQRKLNKIL